MSMLRTSQFIGDVCVGSHEVASFNTTNVNKYTRTHMHTATHSATNLLIFYSKLFRVFDDIRLTLYLASVFTFGTHEISL